MRCTKTPALTILALAVATPLLAADPAPELKQPPGWRGETIALPPGFAPDMTLRGVEVIRFAPGMFDAGAKDFFSYAFVFRLESKTDLSRANVEREFLVYYRGLAKAVSRTPIDVSAFRLALAKAGVRSGRLEGALDWTEPFVTGKPQKLHLEIDTWKEAKHAYIFACVSPAERTAPIWKELRGIREAFRPALAPQWSTFRGPRASGVASDQGLPDRVGLEPPKNIRFNVEVPGLAHSSPIVFGTRVYLTTAISSAKDATFRPGLYGSGDASEDREPHRWVLLCLDAKSGETLWNQTATEGKPKDKRHVKATYANSTPATDGERVVAFFGSQGVFAHDAETGRQLWTRDLGRLDVGAYDVKQYEWGSASSPIIHGGRVFVQCDTQNESFITALDIETGETVWRTSRDELPSWGTPTVCDGPAGPELVTNASNFIRGYDPSTGKELWKLGGSSKITAPTPICARGIIVVASGRSPERPIFAIRAGSRGDLTLADEKTSSEAVAWSKVRRGPYMPTPIIVGERLFVLGNSGRFDCYELETGEELFRERIEHGGNGFSASPVAADGKLYLASENGEVFVLRASDRFELIAKNDLGEPIMATPAIANGTLYVRTQKRLVAVGSAGE